MKSIQTRKRNDVLFDRWSLVHLSSGILLGWLMNPYIGIILLILWEPLEVLVLSPLLAKVNITFGYETLKNSVSDMVFDVIGVLIGSLILKMLITAPFHLF